MTTKYWLGKKMSIETKQKMSEAHKGEKHWNFGGSQTNTGKTHFKKGMTPWNKGTKGAMPTPWNFNRNLRKECTVCFKRYKVPLCRKNSKFCSNRCHAIFKFTGEKNSNWIGGGWLMVRKQVLLEQNYTCQVCTLREPEIMEVNHKLERSRYPELSRDKNNMEVLCPNCHRRKTNAFLKANKHNPN